MLDLTTYTKYYEIKMPEGNVLQIKQPSQEFLMKLVSLKDITDDEVDAAFTQLYSAVKDILNNNINGKKYTDKYIKDNFDISIISLIIKDYIDKVLESLGEL